VFILDGVDFRAKKSVRDKGALRNGVFNVHIPTTVSKIHGTKTDRGARRNVSCTTAGDFSVSIKQPSRQKVSEDMRSSRAQAIDSTVHILLVLTRISHKNRPCAGP
jgi:hypothetical protein